METLGILLRKSDSMVFKAVGNALWEGEGVNDCWQHVRDSAMRRGGTLDSLTDADAALLDEFFAGLGNSGRDEQSRLFSVSIAALEDAQTQARGEIPRGAATVHHAGRADRRRNLHSDRVRRVWTLI